MSEIKIGATQRGFALGEFEDANGVKCSIQKSSWAEKDAIWLGCVDADPKHFVPHDGWRKLEVPKDAVFNTRMHLTREQVARLLPMLQRFVDTGEIGEMEPETHAAWCPEHGPDVDVDEDGCCAVCGATATGEGADKAVEMLRWAEGLAGAIDE